MFNIVKGIEFYINNNYDVDFSRVMVAKDVVLSCISKSNMKRSVTIKGGIVMFNLSKDRRRTTEDIDLDFIRYSLSDNSIERFFDLLSKNDLGVEFKLLSCPKQLRHDDYKGKRVFIQIRDSFSNDLSIKIDIGVSTSMTFEQEDFIFNFESLDDKMILQINSKEQILTEKLMVLLKYGIRSTRYKDIFDMFYLIKSTDLDKPKLLKYINNELFENNEFDYTIRDVNNELNMILNDSIFHRNICSYRNNWLEIDGEEIILGLLEYFKSLEEPNNE